MKILMISDVYFPRVNGVSTSISTFRRELTSLGHEVHLVAPDYYVPTEHDDHITRIPSFFLPLDPEDRMMKMKAARKACLSLHDQHQFDLIHIQTPFVAHYLGVWLSERLRIPRVESYHTFFEEYLYHYLPVVPRGMMRFVARWFSRSQCNAVHGLIVPSDPMLEVLKQYGIITRSEVIPTGLEPEQFAPADGTAFRASYGLPADRPVLLFVGRVAHEKNIGFLLRMMVKVLAQKPEVILLIAGEGPARETLERDAVKLGIQASVKFIGYLDREKELRSCYRSADIFVFSSRTETQGLVLLEAMAQAVPLVATAELGARSVLHEGEGVHIALEDEMDFSSKVLALLDDDGVRQALAERGRQYAEQWSAREMAQRLVLFYQSVIDRGCTISQPRSMLPWLRH